MRFALISDIHGNIVALEAVLDQISRGGVDEVICLGDVATLGPSPGPVIARLRELGCPCIRGNHDAFLLEPDLIRSYTEAPPVVDAVDWCREQLEADDLAWLRDHLSSTLSRSLGEATLLAFHGTPRSNTEDLLATTAPALVDEMLGGADVTVFACGHTHLQMLRQHRGALIVNPGSVGLPFVEHAAGREPRLMVDHAEYALVTMEGGGLDVSLRRVPLSRAALLSALGESDMPLAGAMRRAYC